MQIANLRIENFRSIRYLSLTLDNTTVFIGANNAGKSAILEAVRIALSRRWGQRGTGFTEDDVHRHDEQTDPRTAPPVKIQFEFKEPSTGTWPADMVANLDDIMSLTAEGLNKVSVSITYTWSTDKEMFEPAWEFLDSAGNALPPRRRAINLSGFYNYVLFESLGALRDADTEFTARARNWGGLLRAIKVPTAVEAEITTTLDALDAKILASDPNLARIAETIGRATEIAIEDTPGAAKLRMLPLNVWDMLARAGVILRNENLRPWLPLHHHGQGLQSLSIIFLLQAAISQQLLDAQFEGAEPIFAIEEPEVHLHPQAARTLWQRVSELPGQKLVTTHSPYFVQNVPLHNLRLVRFRDGSTGVASLPREIVSDVPWTTEVDKLVGGKKFSFFKKDTATGNVKSAVSFDDSSASSLSNCWKGDSRAEEIRTGVQRFRHACRVLISEDDEAELSFLGRRLRGEIFFARRWVLVEGPSEFLLLKALGQAYGYDLDQHGVAIIDFQNCGSPGIYAALAEGFHFPWHMISDGDAESEKFRAQLVKRGFSDEDLQGHVETLPPPNCLEDQLIADGHEGLLRKIMTEIGSVTAATCSLDDFKRRLKNKKPGYMVRLAPMVAGDGALAAQMPKVFIALIEKLKNSPYGHGA
jgi:putative ATP-dependent endonuclease of OLD family